MSKQPTALESLKANEQLLKIMEKHTKAYYDRCIKRIEELDTWGVHKNVTFDDLKINKEKVKEILKEELTK